MITRLASPLLLPLAILPIVIAHEHSDTIDYTYIDMTRFHSNCMPMGAMHSELSLSSYLNYPKYATLMYAHILLMVLSWVVLLPIGKIPRC